GRIAGKQVCLATAATEVLGLLRTAAARLLHPRITAKMVEAGRVEPDPLDTCLAHVRKLEPRKHARGVTGKSGAVRYHVEKHRAQSVHARLGSTLEVVGHDEIDLHPLARSIPKALGHGFGPFYLFTTREQLVAILPGPTVVLGVGELHVLGFHV